MYINVYIALCYFSCYFVAYIVMSLLWYADPCLWHPFFCIVSSVKRFLQQKLRVEHRRSPDVKWYLPMSDAVRPFTLHCNAIQCTSLLRYFYFPVWANHLASESTLSRWSCACSPFHIKFVKNNIFICDSCTKHSLTLKWTTGVNRAYTCTVFYFQTKKILFSIRILYNK